MALFSRPLSLPKRHLSCPIVDSLRHNCLKDLVGAFIRYAAGGFDDFFFASVAINMAFSLASSILQRKKKEFGTFRAALKE